VSGATSCFLNKERSTNHTPYILVKIELSLGVIKIAGRDTLYFLIHRLILVYISNLWIYYHQRRKPKKYHFTVTVHVNVWLKQRKTSALEPSIFHATLRHLRNCNWFDKPLLNSPSRGLRWDMCGLIFEKSTWLLPGSTRIPAPVASYSLSPAGTSFYNFFNAKGSQPACFPSGSLSNLHLHH
jgi:hypothetical protein